MERYPHDIIYSWARVFYVYGKNENEKRLVGSLIRSLQNNKEIVINSGPLLRDYMYTKDIASAFVSVLDSSVNGDINICSGISVRISDLVLEFASQMNKKHLVKFEDNIGNQVSTIVGSNEKLLSLGFKPKFSLECGVSDILSEVN